VDLGIEWKDGRFTRKGAALLDQVLVNDPLHWLHKIGYKTVSDPFEKGLSNFLSAQNKPELFGDVVTDMYEAIEALAKVVTGRGNKDLSGNKELLLSKIKASDSHKAMLSEYIDYANKFRHAASEKKPK